MAAATMAGLSAQRMEQIKFEYFSSINSMARKIMQERERIKARHGPTWDKMTPQEQENAIDSGIVDPHIRARYAMHRIDREDVVCYPKLRIETGQKIVHFGDEDITWQDEHSAPFSWETKSQLEFSLAASADQGVSTPQADSKAARVTPTPKASVSEARKPEEESSFWKISSERSKLEREQSDFQSLTPSQIKSLEKGEKPLPSYLRQESEAADPHPPAPAKPTKQRAPKPPAPSAPCSRSRRRRQRHSSIHLHRAQPGPRPSASPRPAGAGSALRAPCRRSATPWMRCSPPTSCPSPPAPPPSRRRRSRTTDYRQAPPFPSSTRAAAS
ncbi:unnamed protein product [Tetraodon nigroviridis]|uniref:(spotted green pufferfish) hypothetical protein n=1 Tax=Tetraodon nigroviridis TaxID=99883 RepID=Q4RF65_TETNG|nr:unnamed protein product [Tetraodon nigroviridis]